MSLPEALKGLVEELKEANGPLEWIGHLVKFLRLIVTEVLIGTLKQAPYGVPCRIPPPPAGVNELFRFCFEIFGFLQDYVPCAPIDGLAPRTARGSSARGARPCTKTCGIRRTPSGASWTFTSLRLAKATASGPWFCFATEASGPREQSGTTLRWPPGAYLRSNSYSTTCLVPRHSPPAGAETA